MTRVLWLISEKSPGHDSQSEGLARAIASLEPATIVRATARLTAPGPVRPFLRFAMGRAGRPLPMALLRATHELGLPAHEAPPPDLIISSGGKSVLAARTLAATHRAKFVYSGEQKRYPNAWFDVIVSPVPGDPRPNAIESVLIPTTVTPNSVEEAASKLEQSEGCADGRLWCMAVGGASRSHRFTDEDWRALATSMNELAARENIRWLLTTSRRTGERAESVLKASLERSTLADAVWWNEKPRRVLHAFMGLAETICVTQDSVTMVTEAVASGRPTIALRPHDVRFPDGSFLPAYFDRLESLNHITRATCEDLTGRLIPYPTRQAIPLTELARHILHNLNAPITES